MNQSRREKYAPWVMGLGLALYPIHNAAGNEFVFLPLLGFAIIAAISIASIDFKYLDLGPRWIYIPLLIICGCSVIQSISVQNWAGALFLPALFLVYLASRKLGKRIFDAIAVLVIVEAVSVIVMMVIRGDWRTGGIIAPSDNYSIAAAVMLIGGVLSAWRGHWWVTPIALIGLLACGSIEGLIGIAAVGITVLVKRDFGMKLVYTVAPILLIGIVYFATGQYQDMLNDFNQIMAGDSASWAQRVEGYQNALINWGWFGHGYETVNFNYYTVHNVPLIVMDQLGPFAFISWLIAVGYCLIKCHSKYALIAVLAMGLVDHLTWTQLAPWFWVIMGVTSVETEKDYIYRGKVEWIGAALKHRLKPSKPPSAQPAVTQ